jgi:hypothetical protein
MRSSVLRLALSLAACALAATGCATASDSGSDGEVGTVVIPLQQTGVDGALYHLSAQFQIDGPSGTQIVDATGGDPSVTLALPPGFNNISVLDGWTLERSVDGGASFTPVSAVLGTPNPSLVRVLANFSSTVVFEFIVRQATGLVTISFGVTLHPRELAGGMVITAGTGDFAPYAPAVRPDYAFYHDASVERLTLPDGTKRLQLSSGAFAGEFFNDTVGLLTGTIGPSFTGGFAQYHFDAKPDGTQEIAGEIDGANTPFPVMTFGPFTLVFTVLPLDTDGFPTDIFFNEPNVPFTLEALLPSGDATATGTLRFRNIPVSN